MDGDDDRRLVGPPPYPDDRRSLGRRGEDLAAEWYEQRGWTVVDRNWRIRAGEIDLVATRDGVVVFCEVKTRRGARFGVGAEAVGWRKQQRIRGLALAWLQAGGDRYRELRFDVADVDGDGRVEVIEGCF
ncbi:MAG: YraN family protein [Acidimicrobiales bacterium]